MIGALKHKVQRKHSLTYTEFRAALRAALINSKDAVPFKKWGLAISGGVDSMALAYMFKKHLQTEKLSKNCYKAFIVDHKARSESTKEARDVSMSLKKLLGSTANILTVKWPEDTTDPSKLSNFESQARKQRYRLLGKACRDEGISHLLVAHHADDVTETVVDRLSRGHIGKGLQGLSACTQIPECEGLYGVYESGDTPHATFPHLYPVCSEHGGVSIVRPLLSFSKERLVTTCEKHKVEWIEDRTNANVTVATRNTIRSLLQSQRLPLALQTESIQRVTLDIQRAVRNKDKKVQVLVRACHIELFDLRSGLLEVRLPKFQEAFGSSAKWKDASEKFEIAKEFFRLMLDLASGKENINTRASERFVCQLFPEEFALLGKETLFKVEDKFNVGGVLVEKVQSYNIDLKQSVWGESKNVLWRMSRQPYASQESPTAIFPARKGPERKDPVKLPKYGEVIEMDKKERFVLWDGRFWIKVRNRTDRPLYVVPLLVNPRNFFVSKMPEPEFFHSLHKQCTSPNNKWILPAIVEPPRGLENQRYGRVVAVPSLGFVMPEYKTKVTWDIKYKKINIEGLCTMPNQPKYVLHKPSSLSHSLDKPAVIWKDDDERLNLHIAGLSVTERTAPQSKG